MIIANGNTWPFQVVEQRRYRFRFLNGCQSRFLILDFGNIPGVEVWQIGNEGGFLAAPVNLTADHGNHLLMGLAERADLIVDFTNVPVGSYVLGNVGPDEPFGGGIPGVDFQLADPESTGQVLEFRVVPAVAPDPTTPPQYLVLPAITPLPPETVTRPLALIEKAGIGTKRAATPWRGPIEALLGNVDRRAPVERHWRTRSPRTRRSAAPRSGSSTTPRPTRTPCTSTRSPSRWSTARASCWTDEDEVALPIQLDGNVTPPEPWESGFKDTVIAYPGQVTRVRARFDSPGQFVWHCHIVEHEDNEMMRPYRIGPEQPGQPM